MSLKLQITGLDELKSKLTNLKSQLTHKVEEAWNDIARKAVEQIVANTPIATGELRNAQTASVMIEGNIITLKFENDCDYAYFVHELPHKLTALDISEGGQVGWKFISRTVDANIFDWQRQIADAIMDLLKE